MKILIEEHKYNADPVKNILNGISNLCDVEGKINVKYIGYFYNSSLKDCVFILPKVLLDANEKVFGKYNPEEIIDLDAVESKLTREEHTFIYELAVWIYRAIVVYKDNKPDNTIVRRQFISQMSKGRLRQSNTFLDIILALLKFNKENQQLFFFILKNIHSGLNKINWNKTINQNKAIIQDDTPIYTQIVNKKKKINFDEELLIIFFSILNYIHEEYGFSAHITLGFELIKGPAFRQYLNGKGLVRLRQIKYKYFSDIALYLWDLCFAFFDQSKRINVETNDQEYLLVSDFDIVFEAIIDDLVGDPRKSFPLGLVDQDDGKRVDHMYRYKDLVHSDAEQSSIYYIGDSKYYKQRTTIGKEALYKQFTYARNVIQWNLDLFSENDPEKILGHIKLRDDITEGYNVIPNFFISATQNELNKNENIQLVSEIPEVCCQFENRLFDRDTLLVARYNVNFLFVVSLYGRNNTSQKKNWKRKVREMFRGEIRRMLERQYQFYVMVAHTDIIGDQFLRENFQMVLGKVFTPYADKDYYSLALDKAVKYKEENDSLLTILGQNVDIRECHLGDKPEDILEKPLRASYASPDPRYLTFHWLEKYPETNIVVGCYKDQAHLDWILGNNDKGTLLYNVRLDREREGAQLITHVKERKVSFVVLYNINNVNDEYHVFRVHHTAVLDEERMRKALYPNPHGRYFCYVFDEEVSLGKLDIGKILEDHQGLQHGAPIYLKGSELIAYRE